MSHTLTKKQMVLNRLHVYAGSSAVFIGEDFEEFPGLPRAQVDFPSDDWEAMGSPETITITIEPGDLLNS